MWVGEEGEKEEPETVTVLWGGALTLEGFTISACHIWPR